MRRLLTVLLGLSLTAPSRAAEEAKHNTLTPKEIADGWILLFDGETPFGWDAAAKPRVEHGTLVYGGDQDIRASPTTAFLYYEMHFDYHIEKTGKDAAFVMLSADKTGSSLTVYKGWAKTSLTVDMKGIRGSTSHIITPDGESRVAEGDSFSSQTTVPSAPWVHSGVPSFSVSKGSRLSLRNVKLKPLHTKPLFNGKDLTGWKKFEGDAKRAKSQFSVTKEGFLSITNGPGDLQTTGEWADFVLQLDCRTNGDNLNSGVFFRCIPGEYQNGYEAQIQNRRAKEPKAYIVEEYDPKTHEIAHKQAMKNWSQDYGTGAIYRRMPARRAAAKDREWFTMTVAARGRHLATWVNGIQMVDWTDNRPENDNARNGCRLKKGPISLQGHDPTTDLSFRNLRIAE
jgi:hypothetical protein